MRKKLAKIAKSIFAVGQLFCMACALCIIVAYIVAFIAGGELAIAIDTFIYAQVFPKLYFIAVALAFIGAANIYLTGYEESRSE